MSKMSKWYKTEDVRPDSPRYVLGHLCDGHHHVVRWDGHMWSDPDGGEFDEDCGPVYWTELPDPPDEEEITEEADFQVAKRIGEHLNWILKEDPDLINRLVLPRETVENPPTVIGLLNRMFKSKVRIVYTVETETDRIEAIYAMRKYPPSRRKLHDIHDLLA